MDFEKSKNHLNNLYDLKYSKGYSNDVVYFKVDSPWAANILIDLLNFDYDNNNEINRDDFETYEQFQDFVNLRLEEHKERIQKEQKIIKDYNDMAFSYKKSMI